MTLKDIWRSFQSRLSFPRPVSHKLYRIRPQLMKLFIRNHKRTFKWYVHCRWPWRCFKVIRLFYIKFLVNGALYGKSYYWLLIGNHTLASDWCHFRWPLRIFEGHFSDTSNFSNLWQTFASRGLQAIAEPLVSLCVSCCCCCVFWFVFLHIFADVVYSAPVVVIVWSVSSPAVSYRTVDTVAAFFSDLCLCSNVLFR